MTPHIRCIYPLHDLDVLIRSGLLETGNHPGANVSTHETRGTPLQSGFDMY